MSELIEDIKLELDVLRSKGIDTADASTKEAIALQYQLLIKCPKDFWSF